MVPWVEEKKEIRCGDRPESPLGQNDCENRVSINSPSFAVALNWGMGSSSLKTDVKAFDRLQIGCSARCSSTFLAFNFSWLQPRSRSHLYSLHYYLYVSFKLVA